MRINENAKWRLLRPRSTDISSQIKRKDSQDSNPRRTMASADLRDHLAEPPELGRALPHANDLGRAEPRAAVHAGGNVLRVVQDVLRPNRYDCSLHKKENEGAIHAFGLKWADPKYPVIPVVNKMYGTQTN
jgi:hypothetical protein